MKKQGTKKGKDLQKTLSKIFIVFILVSCVVGFSLTFSFFSIFKKAEPGNYVVVEYTLSYENGLPIISSSESLVEEAYKNGYYGVALTNPIVLQAGVLQTEKITPVDAVNPAGATEYALFDLELDAISSDVIGMHQDDLKKIELEFADTLTQNMTAEAYNAIGGNFSEAQVGMLVPLAFSYYPESENGSDNTSVKLERPSVITEKTDDHLVMRYGYALAEIQVKQIE